MRLPPTDTDPLTRLVICIQDTPSARLDRHFDACVDFIMEALAKGGCVLVHCHAGQSRSATIVAAYLMRKERLGASEAVESIRLCRPQIHPNTGFVDQLNALELRLGLGGERSSNGGSPVGTSLDTCAAQESSDKVEPEAEAEETKDEKEEEEEQQ